MGDSVGTGPSLPYPAEGIVMHVGTVLGGNPVNSMDKGRGVMGVDGGGGGECVNP
jgi:hypothetical protein